MVVLYFANYNFVRCSRIHSFHSMIDLCSLILKRLYISDNQSHNSQEFVDLLSSVFTKNKNFNVLKKRMYINILSRVYIISNLLKLHFLEFKAIFTFFWLSTNCIFLVWYLLHVKRDTNSGIVFLVKSFRHLHCFIKFILIYRKNGFIFKDTLTNSIFRY